MSLKISAQINNGQSNLLFLLAFIIIISTTFSFADDNLNFPGIWFNEEKDAVMEIKNSEGTISGCVVWLKEPTKEGKPRTDIHNSDSQLRTHPVLGLEILKKFTIKQNGSLGGGTIYDPKSGKTYQCIITFKDQNRLNIRGYIGHPMIGRTALWTRADSSDIK